jgi:hypothetical protein
MAFAELDTPEQLYETAFRRIVEGNYGEAYDRLNEVISKYPDTVHARFAENEKRRLEPLDLRCARQFSQHPILATVSSFSHGFAQRKLFVD